MVPRWFPGRGEVRSPSREQISALGWRYLPALRQASASHFDGAGGAIHTLLRAVEPDLGAAKANLTGLLEAFNTTLEESEELRQLRGGMAEHLSSSMPRAISAQDLAVRTAADPSESVLENVSMYLTRGDDFVPLSEQSDGMRQLISMTLFDLAEGTANVIAIDEPEIHLHPSSQRTVAELLTRDTNQKILVTHSPYIVQRFDPTQVVAVHHDGSCGQLDATAFTLEERDQAHWWSPRMIEALTARYVIVVEGVADRIVMEAAARARGLHLDREGAVVFELGGAENFSAVHQLLGPKGFDIEVLGLVDEAEKGPWLGAVGGRERDVLNRVVFVSRADLEDEYCQGLGAQKVVGRLVAAGVVRDEATLLAACGSANMAELSSEQLADFCRKKAKSTNRGKVPSAIAVTKGLTLAEAASITSIDALLTELETRILL